MGTETAKRDPNYAPTIQGVDMTTGLLATNIYVDETTHRLLVSAVITAAITIAKTDALQATATAVKTSAGSLYGYHIYNPNATVAYLHFYNLSTGSTTVGSSTRIRTLAVPAGGVIDTALIIPIAFSTAITVAATTTASDNKVIGMVAETITSAAYGRILLRGKTVSLKVDGTTDIAVGDFLTTFTSAKIARKATVGTLGTTPGDLAFAVALEAYTPNDSLGVLDALLIPPQRL